MNEKEIFYIFLQAVIIIFQLWIRAEIKALEVYIKSIAERVCNLERKVFDRDS